MGLNRHLTKEDKHMTGKHMKRQSISYAIREMQLKMRYHYTPIKMAKTQKILTTPNAGENVEPQKLSFIATGIKIVQPLWKRVWQSLTK